MVISSKYVTRIKRTNIQSVIDLGKKDEVVLLCDCGGGTVVSVTSVRIRRSAHLFKDIIVYKIVSKDPLELDEVCVGSG